MTYPGIQSPKENVRRNWNRFAQLSRLTQKREQTIALAKNGRHLIHDAARRSGDEVLDLLAKKRHLARFDGNLKGRDDGVHSGYFQRSRGADTFSLRHVRRNQNS